MALLLGPPSSGKTTLLLALADKLDKDLKYSGKITYNGHTMDEFVPRRTSAYIDQNDLHTGQLIVRETLAFSVRVQGVGTNYDMLVELARREKEANIKPDRDIDIYMKAAAIEGQEASNSEYELQSVYWVRDAASFTTLADDVDMFARSLYYIVVECFMYFKHVALYDLDLRHYKCL